MVKAKQAHGAMPRLRFPVFEGAWSSRQLGGEGEFLSSLTGKNGADFGTGNATFIPYMNVFANTFVSARKLGTVRVDPEESQNPVQKGDVLFTVSSETPEDAGMSSVLLEEIPNCYVNSFCALFRFVDGKAPNLVFTGYLLRQPITRTYFAAKAQGSTRFNLSKEAFRSLPLLVPKEGEQQKIADCLSSLDACIGAETRKLDALKTYRQGLMQQLFPAEGQRLPRLRFRGFEGKWNRPVLGDVLTLQYGASLAADSRRTGEVPVVGSNGIVGYHDTPLISGPAIVVGRKGSAGSVTWIDSECFPIDTTFYVEINDENEYQLSFLKLVLENRRLDRLVEKGGVPGLSRGAVYGEYAAIPRTAEQQRIAECMFSFDTLIAIQASKIARLQQHKSGLMQSLFPSPDAHAA